MSENTKNKEIDLSKIRVPINTRLRIDVKMRLDEASKDNGVSIQSIIEEALITHLDAQQGK